MSENAIAKKPGTISRRRILQVGGLSLVPLGLPTLLWADGHAEPRRRGAQAKSCILIVQQGGPSHLDIWDLKPDAPAEIRGPYRPIATRSSGNPGLRTSAPFGPTRRSLLPDPVDAPAEHRAPRRHAHLPKRPVQPAGKRPLSWLDRRPGPAGHREHPLLRLAPKHGV